MGILSTMAGVGSIVLCWSIGYVAGFADMQSGFSIIVITCLLSFLIFAAFYQRLGRRESAL